MSTESQPSAENFSLEYFDKIFEEKDDITLEDLSIMKEAGITTEQFLNYLREIKGVLFHGSRANIPLDSKINSGSREKVYASSDPAIAILKSIYLNNATNLGYPMFINDSRSNFILEIVDPKPDTEGNSGYVYVISDTQNFEADQGSNWQYSKQDPAKDGVSFLKKFEIERDDFKYPVVIKQTKNT